jgi:hypothetical protein
MKIGNLKMRLLKLSFGVEIEGRHLANDLLGEEREI